jgi:hypothetical protein
MSDDFVLTDEETKKLFRAPSRAMKIRQLIWSKAKEGAPARVILSDIVRDHREEFLSAEIYKAARHLVLHGFLTREDVSWATIEKGSERKHYRYAVRFVEPFTNASRKW